MKQQPDDDDALREALDALCLMVETHCADSEIEDTLDSGGSSGPAFAMRVLLKHGRVAADVNYLRVVRGRWVDLSWLDRLNLPSLAKQRAGLKNRWRRRLPLSPATSTADDTTKH